MKLFHHLLLEKCYAKLSFNYLDIFSNEFLLLTFLSFLKIFLLIIYFLILQRKKNMIELSENNKSSMENQNQKQTFICHICEEKFEQCAFEAHFPTCAKQKPIKCELCMQ